MLNAVITVSRAETKILKQAFTFNETNQYLKEVCIRSKQHSISVKKNGIWIFSTEAYDPDKQMCCGPTGNRRILTRRSSHHLCCEHEQYDSETHCCCFTNEALRIDLINSSCCLKELGVSTVSRKSL